MLYCVRVTVALRPLDCVCFLTGSVPVNRQTISHFLPQPSLSSPYTPLPFEITSSFSVLLCTLPSHPPLSVLSLFIFYLHLSLFSLSSISPPYPLQLLSLFPPHDNVPPLLLSHSSSSHFSGQSCRRRHSRSTRLCDFCREGDKLFFLKGIM